MQFFKVLNRCQSRSSQSRTLRGRQGVSEGEEALMNQQPGVGTTHFENLMKTTVNQLPEKCTKAEKSFCRHLLSLVRGPP